MSPELIRKKAYCGKKADCWALGILLYTMLIGEFPFTGKTESELYKNVLKGEYNLEIDFITIEAKNLIKNILISDPELRFDAT